MCDYETFARRVLVKIQWFRQSQPTRNVIFLLSTAAAATCVLRHVHDEYNSYQLSFTRRLAIVWRMDHETSKCDITETCRRCLLQIANTLFTVFYSFLTPSSNVYPKYVRVLLFFLKKLRTSFPVFVYNLITSQ